jgi:sugar lactone lactonase YvrE
MVFARRQPYFRFHTVGFASFALAACVGRGDAPADSAHAIQADTVARITTLAGASGKVGYADGVGTAARFAFPESAVLDPSGTYLYVADGRNDAIRRLDLATGAVFTIVGLLPGAGAPAPGHADGTGNAPGVQGTARIAYPRNLAIDTAGTTIYFTDTNNFAIRAIAIATDASGAPTYAVSTIAGGFPGAKDGVGTAAEFSQKVGSNPALWAGGLALDERDPAHALLYIADSANQTLRLLHLDTRLVETLAGVAGQGGWRDGEAKQALLQKPNQIILDGNGGLYLSESDNIDIRKLDLAAGTMTTVAGKSSIEACLEDPSIVDPATHAQCKPEAGHVCDGATAFGVEPSFVCPVDHAADAAGGLPDDPGTNARFRFPYGMAMEASGTSVLVVDSHSNLIRRFDLESTAVSTVFGTFKKIGDDTPYASLDTGVADATGHPSAGTLAHPTNIVRDPRSGAYYVSDRSAVTLRKLVLAP